MVQRDLFGSYESGASFSPCRKWRYALWRYPTGTPLSRVCAFVGLNPSTADETVNDPTVTRCINYAKSWGFDGLVMLNLFGYRATDPEVMKMIDEPIGQRNNATLLKYAESCGLTVAAWGKHGAHQGRADDVAVLLSHCDLKCLQINKDGSPKHPLYCRSDLKPIPWEPS